MEYFNQELNELKNINKTTIQIEEIIYQIKPDEISTNKNFENNFISSCKE